MNRTLALFLVAGSAVTLAACSSETSSSDFAAERGGTGSGGDLAEGAASGPGGSSSGTGAPGSTSGGSGATQPGALTAGVWDDNLNYEFFGKYLDASRDLPALTLFTQAERDAAHQRALAAKTAKTELDVVLLFDTTGSMGDELSYLTREVGSIAATVKLKFPQTTPRFGLVVYRDADDQYLTRRFDFTADLDLLRTQLAAQAAGGGGDFPEAVPEGLNDAVNLGWRTTNEVARLMFWVADAPHHEGDEPRVKRAVNGAVQKGIHVYPVASSGVDATAELTMRSAAQVTGGRYLFLTDDSGIGNAHAEPHIPCYVVTPLQGAMVRMIESEMSGVRAEPVETEVIRTVGAPVDGKCVVAGQSPVTLY